MNGISGADPAALEDLARRLRAAGDDLARAERRIATITGNVGRAMPVALDATVSWAHGSSTDVQRRARSIAWSNFRAGEAGLGRVVALPPTNFRTFSAARRAARDLARSVADADEDPLAYLDLVAGLERHASDAVFLAAFIEAFGVERFASLPRMAQAIEYADVLSPVFMSSASVRMDVGYVEWDGDPVGDLLAPLSNALASATRSGQLSDGAVRRMLGHEDGWAVGQLLHAGSFGSDFLVDAFAQVVVPELVERSDAAVVGRTWGESLPIGGRHDADYVTTDAAALVLAAVARNPAAARRIVSGRLDERVVVQDHTYVPREVDVFELLAAAPYEDDGSALGEMLAVGADALQSAGEAPAAARVAERMLAATLAGERNGPGLVDGLVDLLAEHHLADLHWSAAAGVPDRDFGSGDGHVVDDRLLLSQLQLTDLLEAVAERKTAHERLLQAVAAYQSQSIAAATVPGASLREVIQVAAFDRILMNAHALRVRGDGEDARADRDRVVAMVDAVTGLAPVSGVAGSAVKGLVRRTANLVPTPSRRDMSDDAYVFEQRVHGGLRASVVAAFHEQGLLDDEVVADLRDVARDLGAQPPLEADRHLFAYGDMSQLQRVAFDTWLLDAPLPDELEDALAIVDRTLAAGDYDL